MTLEQAKALKKGDVVHYYKDTEHLPGTVMSIHPHLYSKEVTIYVRISDRRHLQLGSYAGTIDALHRPEDCPQLPQNKPTNALAIVQSLPI